MAHGNGMLLGSPSRNNSNTICMTEIVFLKYVVDAITKSGMVNIEFEYSSNDCTINYLDVEFSDHDLRKHVEDNPRVLRNIDSYLRNKLLYQEYNLK
jgi:hypothetical protein